MDNTTLIFQQEPSNFDHPLHMKIMLSILTVLILVSLLVISRKLFKFLRRPNRRFLDQIVDFQYSVQFWVVIFVALSCNVMIWTDVPSDYVSGFGCYIGTYIFYFFGPYGNIHSFFIALFRYICIIHPDQLSKRYITPEVIKHNFMYLLLKD